MLRISLGYPRRDHPRPGDAPSRGSSSWVWGGRATSRRDRLDPLVKTLLAWSEQPSPKEVRLAFPANTPSLREGNLKPQ